MTPTDCQEQHRLLDYLYDELSVADAAQYAEHLQGCEACRREVDAFRGVRQLVKAAPQPEMDAGALERMTTQLLLAAGAPAAAEVAGGSAPAELQDGGKVLPFRRRVVQLLRHPGGGVLAAAAAALVVVVSQGLLHSPTLSREATPSAATPAPPAVVTTAPTAAEQKQERAEQAKNAEPPERPRQAAAPAPAKVQATEGWDGLQRARKGSPAKADDAPAAWGPMKKPARAAQEELSNYREAGRPLAKTTEAAPGAPPVSAAPILVTEKPLEPPKEAPATPPPPPAQAAAPRGRAASVDVDVDAEVERGSDLLRGQAQIQQRRELEGSLAQRRYAQPPPAASRALNAGGLGGGAAIQAPQAEMAPAKDKADSSPQQQVADESAGTSLEGLRQALQEHAQRGRCREAKQALEQITHLATPSEDDRAQVGRACAAPMEQSQPAPVSAQQMRMERKAAPKRAKAADRQAEKKALY